MVLAATADFFHERREGRSWHMPAHLPGKGDAVLAGPGTVDITLDDKGHFAGVRSGKR